MQTSCDGSLFLIIIFREMVEDFWVTTADLLERSVQDSDRFLYIPIQSVEE